MLSGCSFQILASGQEQRCRFLVTSLDWNKDWAIEPGKTIKESYLQKKQKIPKDLMPRVIYEKIYCPRGGMENRIKEVPRPPHPKPKQGLGDVGLPTGLVRRPGVVMLTKPTSFA